MVLLVRSLSLRISRGHADESNWVDAVPPLGPTETAQKES